MSSLSKFLLFFATIVTFNTVHAQTSGSGCYVNGDGVYTQYLGDAPYYGNTADMRPVYSNSRAAGSFVARNVMGYKPDGNHYNYVCGQINVFSGAPYGPDQNELNVGSSNCEIAASRNTPSSSASRGQLSTFTYNNPTYCGKSATPNNAPLDDYLSYLISMSGALTFFTLRKNPVF